jgi:hypothetical protein
MSPAAHGRYYWPCVLKKNMAKIPVGTNVPPRPNTKIHIISFETAFYQS